MLKTKRKNAGNVKYLTQINYNYYYVINESIAHFFKDFLVLREQEFQIHLHCPLNAIYKCADKYLNDYFFTLFVCACCKSSQ
jgi:hypothetical protein